MGEPRWLKSRAEEAVAGALIITGQRLNRLGRWMEMEGQRRASPAMLWRHVRWMEQASGDILSNWGDVLGVPREKDAPYRKRLAALFRRVPGA